MQEVVQDGTRCKMDAPGRVRVVDCRGGGAAGQQQQ